MLESECQGDLDWIVLKALEKERDRRYESASAFADDVVRHLKSEPVVAAAPSRVYRLRKFYQRNQGAVLAGAAIVGILVMGLIVSTWLTLEAREAGRQMEIALGEKDEALGQAEEERKRASQAEQEVRVRLKQVEKSSEVLASIFDGLDPKAIALGERPLQDLLADELDDAIEAIEDASIGDPVAVARIQTKLGRALRTLGQAGRSVPILEKALKTFEDAPGEYAGDLRLTLLDLAISLDEIGDSRRALELKRRSLELIPPEDPESEKATLEGKLHLARSHNILGQLDEALKLRREVFQVRARELGREHLDTLRTEAQLAESYWSIGQQDLALEHQEHVCELHEKVLGAEDPQTWKDRYQLSFFYANSGRAEEALELLEAVTAFTEKAYGPDHPVTLDRRIHQSRGSLCPRAR